MAGSVTIQNPHSGERIVIHTPGDVATEGQGRILTFELFLPPGGHVPARHLHPEQVERFTVLTGRLRFRVGRQSRLLGPGQTVVVPPGTPHWFGNPDRHEAHARVEVEPPLRMAELLMAGAALPQPSYMLGLSLPRLSAVSELATFLLHFQRELAVPGVPRGLLRPILSLLSRPARSEQHVSLAR
jgi:quercetin dioxygenase-like cupin family protein